MAAQDATVAKVRDQLQRDYPDGALTWLEDLTWQGPVQVPLRQISWSNAKAWAAAKSPQKVARFAGRMRSGWHKPIVLVRTPNGQVTPVDGHTRLLAARSNQQPVTAWVGTAKTDHGPWEQAHARQKP